MSRRAAVPTLDLIEALHDPHLFGPWFEPRAHWGTWLVFLKTLFGLPMTPAEVETFTRFTGRTTPSTTAAREAWLVVGRRGGKSRIAALIAVFLACFRSYRHILAPGERGVVMVLAADREQARVVLGYIEALLEQVPMLAALIAHRTKEEITLTNRITIRVHTASFRSVRGYTVVAALLDEVAFWRSEDSANPDIEIVAALRPAMATVPEPLLLGISSPYARRGVLWEAFKTHYGQDADPVLVWTAPTRAMNPTIAEAFVAAELEKDEAAARAEYSASSGPTSRRPLPRDREACIELGVHARPPLDGSGTRPSSIRPAASGTPSRSRSRTRRATTWSSTSSRSGGLRSPPRRRSRSSSRCSGPTGCARSSATATARKWSASASGRTAIGYEVTAWTKIRTLRRTPAAAHVPPGPASR